MKSLHFGSATIDVITLIAPQNIERASFANEGTSFLMLEAGRKLAAESITSHVGGGACNTAVSLARRGWEPAVRAKVGDDLNAAAVREHLARNNVGDAMAVSTAATGTAVMIASHDRNASIFVHRGANEWLTIDDLPLFDGYDLIYLAPLSGSSADILPVAADRARAAGAMVAVNPGIRHLSSRGDQVLAALADIDLLSINRVEAEALMPFLGVLPGPGSMPDDPPDLLARGLVHGGYTMGLRPFLAAMRARGPNWIALTDGTHGAYLAGPDGVLWHPALPVEVAGTAGAGDAFCSTLAGALAEGCGPETALRQAACNAASVVGQVDTTSGLMGPEQMDRMCERFKDISVRELA